MSPAGRAGGGGNDAARPGDARHVPKGAFRRGRSSSKSRNRRQDVSVHRDEVLPQETFDSIQPIAPAGRLMKGEPSHRSCGRSHLGRRARLSPKSGTDSRSPIRQPLPNTEARASPRRALTEGVQHKLAFQHRTIPEDLQRCDARVLRNRHEQPSEFQLHRKAGRNRAGGGGSDGPATASRSDDRLVERRTRPTIVHEQERKVGSRPRASCDRSGGRLGKRHRVSGHAHRFRKRPRHGRADDHPDTLNTRLEKWWLAVSTLRGKITRAAEAEGIATASRK